MTVIGSSLPLSGGACTYRGVGERVGVGERDPAAGRRETSAAGLGKGEGESSRGVHPSDGLNGLPSLGEAERATRCGHEDYLAQERASGVAVPLLARNLSGVGAVLGSVHAHHRNGDVDQSQLETVHAPSQSGVGRMMLTYTARRPTSFSSGTSRFPSVRVAAAARGAFRSWNEISRSGRLVRTWRYKGPTGLCAGGTVAGL